MSFIDHSFKTASAKRAPAQIPSLWGRVSVRSCDESFLQIYGTYL